jgi:anti-sigma factor ChrR (cupin superfamily)
MTIDCDESRHLAAEFALGILDAPSRKAVAQHLLGCPECRSEVTSLKAVHRRLLELVPGTEPPLDFDRRVLSSLAARRGRHRGAALSLAAGLTFVAVAGWAVAATRHDRHTVPSAAPHQAVLTVRESKGSGSGPPWLEVTVHSADADVRVTCQLLESTRQVIDLGSFDLVNGDGQWGAPDNAGLAKALAVRVTDGRGDVIASTPPPR